MKCNPSDEVTPALIRKSKRKVHFRRGRGGQIVGQGWPKPRRNRGTPNQASWVQDFINAARDIKLIDPCTHQTAANYADAPCSGYTFYRDYLMTARAGKLISYEGNGRIRPQTPRLFRNKEEGIPRVTTPTASVYRAGAESIPASTDKILTPNTFDWDNNAFWDPTANPSRLTFRAAGLYFIHVEVAIGGSSTASSIQAKTYLNGSAMRQIASLSKSNAILFISHSLLWYFNAGDFLEAGARVNASGLTAELRAFQVVAITPEAIV